MAGAADRGVIREAAQHAGIAPAVLWGVYGTESSFGHNPSRSSAGAEGPFQFEPGTARSVGVKDVQNLRESAFGAARYLAQFKDRGLAGMLSAYNAGPAGGLQHDYVNKVLANAKSWGSETSALPSAGAPGESRGPLGISSQVTQTVDPQAIGEVLSAVKALAGPGIVAAQANPQRPSFAAGPVMPAGTKPPQPLAPVNTGAQALIPMLERALAGTTDVSSSVTPGARIPGAAGASSKANLTGLLAPGASYQVHRTDEGKDLQLKPGQEILANGNYEVVAVPSDPKGFGPAYPVVKFTSGPDAGRTIYFGHVDARVKPGQRGQAGDVLANTSKTGHNAPPGWIEIGLWGPNGPLAAGNTSNSPAGQLMARLLGL